MSARREPIGLSRQRVCAAALALVDEEGLEALTMRRLAARLDCEAMSLYNHVKDKADLLDLLHAAVLGSLEPDAPFDHMSGGRGIPPWRAILGGLARALRTALLRHPNVLPLFTARPVSAPEAVATVTRVEEAFLQAGFSAADADRDVRVVGMFTIGHAIFDANADPGDHPTADARRRAATFQFGLEALLDGVERAHHQAAAKTKAAPRSSAASKSSPAAKSSSRRKS